MPTKHNTPTPEHAAALLSATATVVAAALSVRAISIGGPSDIAELVRVVGAALRESAH
jgi:hypothetical protein